MSVCQNVSRVFLVAVVALVLAHCGGSSPTSQMDGAAGGTGGAGGATGAGGTTGSGGATGAGGATGSGGATGGSTSVVIYYTYGGGVYRMVVGAENDVAMVGDFDHSVTSLAVSDRTFYYTYGGGVYRMVAGADNDVAIATHNTASALAVE